LDANLGSAELARLVGAPKNFFEWQKITFFGQMAATESTETTSFNANVGEVDVAVDDIRDDVPDGPRAQTIGGGNHRHQIGSSRVEQVRGFVDGNVLIGQSAVEDFAGGA
jgi:hypothetical protein